MERLFLAELQQEGTSFAALYDCAKREFKAIQALDKIERQREQIGDAFKRAAMRTKLS